MKAVLPFSRALALAVIFLLAADLHAAMYRRNNNTAPKANNPPPAQPPQTKAPAPKQETFKDLPVNTTFYFASDINKAFPRLKISDTMARSLADGIVGVIPLTTPVASGAKKPEDNTRK